MLQGLGCEQFQERIGCSLALMKCSKSLFEIWIGCFSLADNTIRCEPDQRNQDSKCTGSHEREEECKSRCSDPGGREGIVIQQENKDDGCSESREEKKRGAGKPGVKAQSASQSRDVRVE